MTVLEPFDSNARYTYGQLEQYWNDLDRDPQMALEVAMEYGYRIEKLLKNDFASAVALTKRTLHELITSVLEQRIDSNVLLIKTAELVGSLAHRRLRDVLQSEEETHYLLATFTVLSALLKDSPENKASHYSGLNNALEKFLSVMLGHGDRAYLLELNNGVRPCQQVCYALFESSWCTIVEPTFVTAVDVVHAIWVNRPHLVNTPYNIKVTDAQADAAYLPDNCSL